VQRFLGNTVPIAEFVEVESGKRHKNRPQLQAALDLYKKKKARLVIAKLDRLARNVAFISALMESEVDFVCCDNPHANRLMLHIMAAFAEHERDIISERIKATIGRIKAELAAKGFRVSHAGRRYTRLGSPDIEAARLKAWEARRALTPSEDTLAFMRDLRGGGASFRRIAEELNRWKLRTGQREHGAGYQPG
jgi:DNA invertase Pin-like site-specific DNA recombinase